jgi:hypothetical protein
MRAFVRHVICFLLIQGCIWGGVLVLYRRYAAGESNLTRTGYFAASIDKHHVLVHQPSPRIVLVGGSNLAFGVDSSMMGHALGYHPVNMGLHLGLGLDFMLTEVAPFLKPGDVVLISLEYEHFIDLYYGDASTLFIMLQVQPSSIHFLTFGHAVLLLDQGLMVMGSMIRHSLRVLSGERQGEASVYQRSAFNQFGDFVAHHTKGPQPFPVDRYKPPTHASMARVIQRLNHFHAACQRQGILVFYSYPPLVQEQMQANRAIIQDIAGQLAQQLHMPLLDTPEEMSLPVDYFFDGPYHLNVIGTGIRTSHLITKLHEKRPPHSTELSGDASILSQ